jgi:hypothetical protein
MFCFAFFCPVFLGRKLQIRSGKKKNPADDREDPLEYKYEDDEDSNDEDNVRDDMPANGHFFFAHRREVRKFNFA